MFYHIVSDANTRLLGIDNIGFSSDPNNNKFGPGQRNLYLIHYVISGKGYFNGVPVAKGNGFLIKPHTYEHYYPDKKTPWTFLWITSRDPAMEEIFEQYNADSKTKVFDYNYISVIQNVTETIRKNHNKLYSPTEILEIFLNIFNNQCKVCRQNESMSDVYYNYVLNYVNSNLYRTIRVDELTKILNITQPYLYKIFKTKLGISPKEYIDRCKINESKRMLSTTSMSITEIANSVGYDDILVFSKFFKNKVGVSPKNFRLL